MLKNYFFITISLFFLCEKLMAQTSNSYLLFQHFGINENQSELNYISRLLEENNLTIAGPNQEKAIIEAHNFYLSHKEEIDMNLKAEELVLFRSAVKEATKEAKAAAWAQALSAISTSIQSATIAAQQLPNKYQEKKDIDRNIQSYIAQHSHKSFEIPQQNFGNNNTTSSQTTTRRRVTTSNGYEEPLPSVPSNNTNPEVVKNVSTGNVIQAVYVQGDKLVSCRLNINENRIWGYSTSKDPLSREEWNNFYPESPVGTMPIKDGNYAKDYKYTISAGGKTFYFNK